MKISNRFLSSLVLACTATVAQSGHASDSIFYTVEGNLIDYTVSIPGIGSISAIPDPSHYQISVSHFNLLVDNRDSIGSIYAASGWVSEEYHNLNFSTGSLSAQQIVPSSDFIFGTSGAPASTVSYDAATRTLSLSGGSTSSNNTTPSYCVGSAAICGPLFTPNSVSGLIDMTLVFNTNMNFTGVATLTKNIQGTIITATYNLHGYFPQVPVPAAGWLLGSGLVGLGAAARRRRLAQ